MPWKCSDLFSCCCQRNAEDVRELNYNHHSLKEVPSAVFAHERTLEELHMEANRIVDLPRALFHCHELRVLNLSDNDIKTLPPAVASLINLKHLNLSKNSLSNIPDNIKCCKQLVYVNVSVNPLDKLPDGFTQLIALEELFLNDTFLEFLPANFGRLSRLRNLDLRENHLNTLPKSISRLANLEILDIGHNEFSDLPEVLGNLPELCDLWADCNKIRAVPSFIGNLTKLVNLDLANNNIKWIAPEIEKCSEMSYLILSGNELTSLPEEIGNLRNITMLKVDENDLEALPRSIGKLTHLEELVFSQNMIESIPPTIGLLRKVAVINADDNRLAELPSELCSCASLRVLSVRNNELLTMPAEIGHLAGVKVINIADNLLRNLPVSVLNLTNLSALWLSTNQSTPLTTLQQEVDPKTGLMVCVNFLFPQQDQERNLRKPDLDECETVSVERPPRPHIRFADSTDLRNTSRLTRAPTPYPKELRSMAKHARILTTKPALVLQDSDEEMPLVDAHGKRVPEEDMRPVWPTQAMMSRTSLHPVRTGDQPQVYEGEIPCDESDCATPLLAEEKSEHGLPAPKPEPRYLGLPASDPFGGGENTCLPSDNAVGPMSVSPILVTRSDIGPTMPSNVDGNTPDLPALTATVSLPTTGAVHFGRLLTDPTSNERSLENIASELDLGRDIGLNGNTSPDGDPSALDVTKPAASYIPAAAKVPPPYHIAAIHSKQAVFFMNASNGQANEEGASETAELLTGPTALETTTSMEETQTVLPDAGNSGIPADKEDSTDLDVVPSGADKMIEEFNAQLSGLTLLNIETSPRNLPISNIPVLKPKDAESSDIPKPPPNDTAEDDIGSAPVKAQEQSPREFPLTKIPSFSIKDPKSLVAKKPSGTASNNSSSKLVQPGIKAPSRLVQPMINSPTRITQPTSNSPTRLTQPVTNLPARATQLSNSPTKLLQPGFHAIQLPLSKSPTAIPLSEPESDAPSNGNRDKPDDEERSEANAGTGGFKSRIPARVSPVKGSATPSSPTSPSWVFGQHKNATVFPLTLVKSPGIGFSICSGTASPEKPDASGIFVSKVQANGPASGALVPGDKILEVDGVDFAKIDYEQAVGILKQTKNIIHLMISRQK